MNMNQIFKTPRLKVRQFNLNDIDLIVEINNHPECIRFNGWESMSLDECQTVLDRWMSGYSDYASHGAFCVVEVETNRPIGMTFVKPLDDVNAFEIGFRLRRDAWGKGYAKELVAAYIGYCATELHAEYIVAEVSAENHRSRNVFEKMGFDVLPHPDGPFGVWYEKVLV